VNRGLVKGDTACFGGLEWAWRNEGAALDPQASIDRENALFEQVHTRQSRPTIFVWRNRKSLVIPRSEWRKAVELGVDRVFATDGWPIGCRNSGGTAVVHGPGTLNVSLVYTQGAGAPFGLDKPYRLLFDLLHNALLPLGLPLRQGKVEGAFCNGNHDISCHGLKVAGTAQRIRPKTTGGGEFRQTILVHANILVGEDAAAMANIINVFYRAIGIKRVVDANSSANLSELVGRRLSCALVAAQIRRTLVDQLDSDFARSALGGDRKRAL